MNKGAQTSCRVLLSAGVPEYIKTCPDYVMHARDPSTAAARIVWALTAPPASYPVEKHGWDVLEEMYANLLT